MLRDRVNTAIDLYKAGKVQKLLMTGDNSHVDYNEPDAMKAYAVAQGVPAADIQPDYGGRRTYDSCYRAKAVFQVDEAIVVTQGFHLSPALFLCTELGSMRWACRRIGAHTIRAPWRGRKHGNCRRH